MVLSSFGAIYVQTGAHPFVFISCIFCVIYKDLLYKIYVFHIFGTITISSHLFIFCLFYLINLVMLSFFTHTTFEGGHICQITSCLSFPYSPYGFLISTVCGYNLLSIHMVIYMLWWCMDLFHDRQWHFWGFRASFTLGATYVQKNKHSSFGF